MSEQHLEGGFTRREALRRGAALGASLVWAVPVVQTIGMGRAFAQVPSPAGVGEEDLEAEVLPTEVAGAGVQAPAAVPTQVGAAEAQQILPVTGGDVLTAAGLGVGLAGLGKVLLEVSKPKTDQVDQDR